MLGEAGEGGREVTWERKANVRVVDEDREMGIKETE